MSINWNNIKYISLVLENCDEIHINIKDIQDMKFENIKENLIFHNDEQRFWIHQKCAQNFHLLLKPSANQQHKQFGGMTGDNGNYTVFDRLTSSNDICYVELLNKNFETIDTIYVVWKEKNSYALGSDNLNQRSRLKRYWNNINTKCLEITIKDWSNNINI